MASLLSHAAPTEPALDTPKPVADGLWIVDSGPHRVMGLELPVRMTVVRLSNGFLWLHSPTRHTSELKQALDRLGPVRHLVAPNIAHWSYLRPWQPTYPMAVTWAAPGLRDRTQVRKSNVRLDQDLGDEPPPDWAGEIDQVIVPGAGFREVAFLHKPSRTLILTDLMVNIDPAGIPRAARPLARLLGVAGSDGRPAVYVRLSLLARRRAARAVLARMIAWDPERVIFSHGHWFEADGTAALRRGFSWLL